MSEDDNNGNDNEDVDLDFTSQEDDTSEENDPRFTMNTGASLPLVKHYKPAEEDMKTLEDIIKRFPEHNPLDIVKGLKLIEQGREDKNFFTELLGIMGLATVDPEEPEQ